MKNKAQPFETAPKDGTQILAFHKIWKCWIEIKRRENKEKIYNDCEWIECTFATVWPEDAFTHWREAPPPPEDD